MTNSSSAVRAGRAHGGPGHDAARIIAQLFRAARRSAPNLLALAALSSTVPLARDAAAATPSAAPRLEAVAPGVYVQRGEGPPPYTANRGVLIGPTGVLVVNPGRSRADGAALLAAIARLTPLPVVLAIDTQATPDAVLGNAAFAMRGVPILAHRATATFMAHNCAACVADFAQQGGTPPDATPVAAPNWLIDASTSIEPGGRAIDVLHFGWTEQAGTLAVFDRASGVLFTGNLARFDNLPDVRVARLPAWRAALQQLQDHAARRVVPGHGPVGGPARLAEVAGYLRQLDEACTAAYAAGTSLQDAVATVAAPAFRDWIGYAERQPRNVHFTYLELERAELDAQGRPAQQGADAPAPDRAVNAPR
jgi:glyoxylase-like metal-dependent hydrolase (beta-lactamase superfamily II)